MITGLQQDTIFLVVLRLPRKTLNKTYIPKKLQETYLGFIVEKPINRNVIGRTLLKQYPRITGKDNRHFPAVVKNDVHLFGISLEIESLQYQQQDKGVCGCATVAIWSSIQKLSALFDVPILSPFEITQKANLSYPSPERTFPSRGLTTFQISSFLKTLSLDEEYINIEKLTFNEKNVDNPTAKKIKKEYIKSILYAYLGLQNKDSIVGLGIPIIGGITLKKGKNKGLHAVTITGFQIKGDKYKGNRANNIKEIYIHDDHIGPFSRVLFNKDIPWDWNNEWKWKEGYDAVELKELFIPVYHKIRLPFSSVYYATTAGLFFKGGQQPESFEIFLTTSNEYKKYLSTKNITNKINILVINLPRFIWIIRVYNSNEVKDTILDATDTIIQKVLPDLEYKILKFYFVL